MAFWVVSKHINKTTPNSNHNKARQIRKTFSEFYEQSMMI